MLGAIVIAVSVIVLLFWAAPGSTGKELTIQDVLSNSNKYQNEFVCLQGNLIQESIQWNPDKIELCFTIQDENKNRLPVVYHGVKPNTFTEGTIVIVEGQYHPKEAAFVADSVKTRCPSKYEGQPYDPKLHEQLKKRPASSQ